MSERAPDYAQGFKDGFAAGLEEGKKQMQSFNSMNEWNKTKQFDPAWVTPTSIHETCPKCGIKIGNVMGYVCGSINCPVQYRATSDVGNPMTGSLDSGLGRAIWK